MVGAVSGVWWGAKVVIDWIEDGYILKLKINPYLKFTCRTSNFVSTRSLGCSSIHLFHFFITMLIHQIGNKNVILGWVMRPSDFRLH